ncbi:hypothetical protein HPB51_008841 [Rhipicephalus microplus]|uniref:Tc1-like transposase DDE domain-containing protein n=1 Tax=Rhipicephalus microplus TaxID=6941 RepID=A0A9J6ESF6_RHIMP|nr:hypothetical protein HPB51_008841 [Rhipicephalus microplus]
MDAMPSNILYMVRETQNYFAHSNVKQPYCIDRIVSQYEALRLHFATVSDRNYNVRLLKDMYEDEKNLAYVTFLAPILADFKSEQTFSRVLAMNKATDYSEPSFLETVDAVFWGFFGFRRLFTSPHSSLSKMASAGYSSSTSLTEETPPRAASPPAAQPYQALSNQKLSVQAKKVAYNVYAQVRRSDPQLSLRAACRKVSELTGVSERSVFRIKLDVKSGTLKSPKRKRLRLPAMDDRAKTGKTRLELHDSFSLAALRRKVHQYFLRNELPTAAKLAQDVTSDSDMNMPKMSVRTMQRLLNDIGFSFRKQKRNCELLERDDIITWRRRYLRTIRQLRAQKRPIYYLDETWVNAGHTKDKVWEDANITTREEAFRQGLTTGLRAPSGKGGRLILLHAGSEDGFLNSACLLFRAAKRSGDYHTEMDGPRFEKWFGEQLLPDIKPCSVIVMDSAPYHSVRLEHRHLERLTFSRG